MGAKTMPRDEKSKDNDEVKRNAEPIAEGYEERGDSEEESTATGGEAADDEETMPIEEGFSIVP
jgi:hypothetical protein